MAAQQVPAIHMQGLEKSYKELQVLRGVGSFHAVTNALPQPPRQGSITACRYDGPRLANRPGRALRIGHPHRPAG
jgi:hypothetical protein